MKKLGNKGFAISGVVYSLLLLFVIILYALLSLLADRKIILDKTKKDLLAEINGEVQDSGSGGSTSSAVKTIIDKNINGNTEGLFTDDFGNVRYRGNDSVTKNYVTFNDEVWRIIGVFDDKIKLIRDDRISNPNSSSNPSDFLWNTNGTNDWNTSDLKDYLNGSYYNSLKEVTKSMIEDTKYNLGGMTTTSIMKKEAYEKERGTEVYSGRPTEWTGKIALMYVSDYGYSAGVECTQILYNYDNSLCKNNNWLYKSGYFQWTLTPYSSSVSFVSYGSNIGNAGGNGASSRWLSARPTIHLKSNIIIASGDGTKSNPYILS